MTAAAITGIRSVLSSAVVGGIAVAVALCLLSAAQILTWQAGHRRSTLTLAVAAASGLSCVVVLVLIAARFLIID
jgi:hypothetical protein